jgi:hypothetical protein
MVDDNVRAVFLPFEVRHETTRPTITDFYEL